MFKNKYRFKNFIIYRLTSNLVSNDYLESLNDKSYSSNLVDQKSYTFEELKKYADDNISDKNFLLIIYDQAISSYVGNIRISIYDSFTGGFG